MDNEPFIVDIKIDLSNKYNSYYISDADTHEALEIEPREINFELVKIPESVTKQERQERWLDAMAYLLKTL